MDAKNMWNNLVRELESDKEILTRDDFYRFMLQWVENNLYDSINKRLSIVLNHKGVQSSDSKWKIEDEVMRLKNLSPNSKQNIAMILTDILWDYVVTKSSIECPNCGDDELSFLIARRKGNDVKEEILLSCDNCGWEQDVTGNKWVGECESIRLGTSQEMGFHKELTT